MAVTYIPTKLKLSQAQNAGPQVKFDSDTFVCLIVTAGASIPDTTKNGIQFIADVLATNPEVVYGTYSRKNLGAVSVAFDLTAVTAVDWSFGTVTFPQDISDPGTGRYVIFADISIGANDAAHPVVAVCDPGGFVSCAPSDLLISLPATGLIQWT